MKKWFPPMILWGVCAASTHADEFKGHDFSLRFPATLTRFSPYADIAGKGGSSAAGKFGSSINPASVSWSFPEPYDFGLSAQYSALNFDEGTNLHVITESMTFDTRDFGVIRFSFGHIFSNEEEIHGAPVLFDYTLSGGRFDWAKRLGGWAFGASYGITKSDTEFRSAPIVLADSTRWTHTFRAGVLFQPAPRWLLGLTGEYVYAPTETEYTTPTPLGLVRRSTDDPMKQVVIRPGISYEWLPNALIQLDYQYARFWNDTGELELHRISAGADLPLARFLFIRGGVFADQRGNLGWTAGMGIYPRKGLTIDFAYQNDNFPEVAREFGRAQTFNASLSFQF